MQRPHTPPQILPLLFLATLLSLPLHTRAQQATDVRRAIEQYITTYDRTDALLSPSKLESCTVNDADKTITISATGGFQEQLFTPSVVEKIEAGIQAALPEAYKEYALVVRTDGERISDLVPNFLRDGKKDRSREWRHTSTAQPWTENISRPYRAERGLEGTHIALWPSHGSFYDAKKSEWRWQRPRLFCSTEDLLSQSIVVPYIIPMLENAGAVVFTPRERDWQRHEVIVDNDLPQQGGSYIESAFQQKAQHEWQTAGSPGFAWRKTLYQAIDRPFSDGTYRTVPAVSSAKQATMAQWVPDIPESGRYAVYVSYHTEPNSTDAARYVVFHKGGMTEVRVNQQMGGGTWVYLGTFEFEAGQHDYGMVVLTNVAESGSVVTADAVRFGGGMGNIARGLSRSIGGTLSGHPRWAEAARYSQQWYGMPDSIYDFYEGENDYNSDILSRPRSANYLAGGSTYVPNQPGLGVPIELQLAFHTDAGFHRADSVFGSLSICTTDFTGGVTDAGVSRRASYDLASLFLQHLQTDLKQYGWRVRKLWNRNYGETRVPMTPAVILEMLSHQNFADMRLAYDPHFKFDFARSVYKTIVKQTAEMHQRDYVIQPLPVRDFAVMIDERKQEARLSWQPTDDESEPTARATDYIVYTRVGYGAFDNGRMVSGTTCDIPMRPDEIYSFRVCAVNKGGQSFPSETLAACISSRNEGTVLIVNAFTRLSGPAAISTATRQGFDLDADPGVPYGAFNGFCGRQQAFDLSRAGSEATDGLGYSGSELEDSIVMGNTFDYAFLHGKGIQLTHRHSFASCSESTLHASVGSRSSNNVRLSQFKAIDVIYGVQTDFHPATSALLETFMQAGGHVFVSGANLFKQGGLQCPSLHATLAATLTSRTIDNISGSGLNFHIYRGMNAKSYAVPAPESIQPQADAFAMLAYSNGQSAAVAYPGKRHRAITFGFPLESITDAGQRNQLMAAVISFLFD
jgi:hypothetical protein